MSKTVDSVEPRWYVAEIGEADTDTVWVKLRPLKYGQPSAPTPTTVLAYAPEQKAMRGGD